MKGRGEGALKGVQTAKIDRVLGGGAAGVAVCPRLLRPLPREFTAACLSQMRSELDTPFRPAAAIIFFYLSLR